MRRDEWERFDPRAVDAAMRLLGVAVIACAATDAWAGAWRVHGGELFPWRHLPGFPLYGRAMLVVEWAIDLLAGVALIAPGRRALGAWLGIAGTALGLSQRYSNHRALLLIVLVFVALDPPDVREPDFAARDRPNLALVRAQLGIVYVASALHKALHGFLGGASLASLFGWPIAVARPLALGVVIAELAIPALLALRPRVGIAAAIALHAAMAWLLPSVVPFSITMIAMAFAFVTPRDRLG